MVTYKLGLIYVFIRRIFTSCQDEDRLAMNENDAPTWEELNAQMARGPDELEMFNRLDREMNW